jgi:hypothetical protein
VKTGVQEIGKALKKLDSGFRRNDVKKTQIDFFTPSPLRAITFAGNNDGFIKGLKFRFSVIPVFTGMTIFYGLSSIQKSMENNESKITTTPTNSVYGAMQDGYVERFHQKISPRPSFPKRGITISPFGKGGIRGIL